MSSISLLQWRKAYMLEFIANDEVKECFTFSVPPESEEFDFPQRITETKTFGGSVFDDYGNDSYRITITGTTVNEDKKFIYKGKKPPQYLTGTKEIFELQKIIKDWANGEVATGFFRDTSGTIGSNRKVYLYDLSKMSVLQIAAGTASRNYWRVFIKDLKIRRDKSKPKTYNYTLEMVGIEEAKTPKEGLFGKLEDGINKITAVVEKIQTVVNLTQATMDALAQISDHCVRVKLAKEMADKRKEQNGGEFSSELIALNIGSALDLVTRIFGGDNNSYYNATRDLLHSITAFKGLASTEESSSTQDNESTDIPKDENQELADGGLKSIAPDTSIDKSDLLNDYVSQMEDAACTIVALSKQKQTNPKTVIYVDNNGNDTAVTVYGYNYHIWTSSDSFDKLATNILGDAEYGTLIAYFNKVASESKLEAGSKIKIPILTEDSTNSNNQIYAEPDKQDSYGADIKISQSGEIEAGKEDVEIIANSENLNQALLLRLTTASSKRIRLSSYGVRSAIGEAAAIESYLSSAVEQTVKADPRVSAVNELRFEGNKDTLNLQVVYTDINGESGQYNGGI